MTKLKKDLTVKVTSTNSQYAAKQNYASFLFAHRDPEVVYVAMARSESMMTPHSQT